MKPGQHARLGSSWPRCPASTNHAAPRISRHGQARTRILASSLTFSQPKSPSSPTLATSHLLPLHRTPCVLCYLRLCSTIQVPIQFCRESPQFASLQRSVCLEKCMLRSLVHDDGDDDDDSHRDTQAHAIPHHQRSTSNSASSPSPTTLLSPRLAVHPSSSRILRSIVLQLLVSFPPFPSSPLSNGPLPPVVSLCLVLKNFPTPLSHRRDHPNGHPVKISPPPVHRYSNRKKKRKSYYGKMLLLLLGTLRTSLRVSLSLSQIRHGYVFILPHSVDKRHCSIAMPLSDIESMLYCLHHAVDKVLCCYM
ncbi:unnamed protein product [Periconia digitata]|uniref:Uncharacterized protein n=1 Tax=Periconia digitata TaxID=1303443 RepID=A0A9W4UDY8_9PLEO|nr:unnamed protein product [Periconia digitata]